MPVRTCLSPGVGQIVCLDGVSSALDDGRCLTDLGTLNWTYLRRLLPVAEDTSAYFRQSVQNLAPVFAYSQSRLQHLSSDDFEERFAENFRWTSNFSDVCRCFALLHEDYRSRVVLSLLLSTAILERALGDVYLLKGRQCPSLLKDILVSKELDNLFGPSVIQILRILIGSPISLNLRNLVWHGFPAPDEIPQQYGYFLLLVIASLGTVLNQSGVMCEEIKHRLPVRFDITDRILLRFGDLQVPVNDDYRQLCVDTDLIVPQFLPMWEDVFDLFEKHRYGECVALLFPMVENGLRQMFARLNNCPERILTAESSVLYTTFDDLLAKLLQDGSKNQLLVNLGQPIIDMLQDLMVYGDGPRFRDRLGHGEAVFTAINRDQTRTVVLVTLTLLQHFTPPDKIVLQTPWCRHLSRVASSYVTVFHPVSILLSHVDELCDGLYTWSSVVQYTPNLIKIVSGEESKQCRCSDDRYTDLHREVCLLGCRVFQQMEKNWGNISDQIIDEFFNPDNSVSPLVELVLKSEVVSNLRWSIDSSDNLIKSSSDSAVSPCEETRTRETVNLLRRMITECVNVSSNVVQTTTQRQQQLEDKQLRSRQRETFKRQLTSLPCLTLGLRLVLLISLQQLTMADSPEKNNRAANIKFLKSMLQYCENMRTYTSLEKNKWLESIDITHKFVDRAKTAVQR